MARIQQARFEEFLNTSSRFVDALSRVKTRREAEDRGSLVSVAELAREIGVDVQSPEFGKTLKDLSRIGRIENATSTSGKLQGKSDKWIRENVIFMNKGTERWVYVRLAEKNPATGLPWGARGTGRPATEVR